MTLNCGPNEPIQEFFLDFSCVYGYNVFIFKFEVLSTREG